jgi:hypothetical protein
VGFYPIEASSKWDGDKEKWLASLKRMNKHEEDGVSVIYLKQEQVELSACVIGANPNAVARAYKGGALKDEDIERIDQFLQSEAKKRQAQAATPPHRAARGSDREDAFQLAMRSKTAGILSRL